MMTPIEKKVFDFCSIQIQILKDKEDKLRKELFDCKVQVEFLSSMIDDLIKEDNDVK